MQEWPRLPSSAPVKKPEPQADLSIPATAEALGSPYLRAEVLKSGASYPLSRAKRAPLRGEGDETPGALRSGLRRNGPSLGVGRAEWETARTLGESTPYPAGGPSPPGPGLIPEGSRCCQ